MNLLNEMQHLEVWKAFESKRTVLNTKLLSSEDFSFWAYHGFSAELKTLIPLQDFSKPLVSNMSKTPILHLSPGGTKKYAPTLK